jgi:hypothetical protein
MKWITINGKDYPYKLTLGAQKRFDEAFKKDGISILRWLHVQDKIEVRHLIKLHYEGVKAGCALEGFAFDMTEDQFADRVSMDDLAVLTDEAAPTADESDADGKKKG